MAVAILRFDLGDPDDEKAHSRACKADDLFSVVWSFLDHLRSLAKYDNKARPSPSSLRAELAEELKDHGIDVDNLWS